MCCGWCVNNRFEPTAAGEYKIELTAFDGCDMRQKSVWVFVEEPRIPSIHLHADTIARWTYSGPDQQARGDGSEVPCTGMDCNSVSGHADKLARRFSSTKFKAALLDGEDTVSAGLVSMRFDLMRTKKRISDVETDVWIGTLREEKYLNRPMGYDGTIRIRRALVTRSQGSVWYHRALLPEEEVFAPHYTDSIGGRDVYVLQGVEREGRMNGTTTTNTAPSVVRDRGEIVGPKTWGGPTIEGVSRFEETETVTNRMTTRRVERYIAEEVVDLCLLELHRISDDEVEFSITPIFYPDSGVRRAQETGEGSGVVVSRTLERTALPPDCEGAYEVMASVKSLRSTLDVSSSLVNAAGEPVVKDTLSVYVSCAALPLPRISCASPIMEAPLKPVSLSAVYSDDSRSGRFRGHLDYHWHLHSAPAASKYNSGLPGISRNGSKVEFEFEPDVRGQYVVALRVSDGCRMSPPAYYTLTASCKHTFRSELGEIARSSSQDVATKTYKRSATMIITVTQAAVDDTPVSDYSARILVTPPFVPVTQGTINPGSGTVKIPQSRVEALVNERFQRQEYTANAVRQPGGKIQLSFMYEALHLCGTYKYEIIVKDGCHSEQHQGEWVYGDSEACDHEFKAALAERAVRSAFSWRSLGLQEVLVDGTESLGGNTFDLSGLPTYAEWFMLNVPDDINGDDGFSAKELTEVGIQQLTTPSGPSAADKFRLTVRPSANDVSYGFLLVNDGSKFSYIDFTITGDCTSEESEPLLSIKPYMRWGQTPPTETRQGQLLLRDDLSYQFMLQARWVDENNTVVDEKWITDPSFQFEWEFRTRPAEANQISAQLRTGSMLPLYLRTRGEYNLRATLSHTCVRLSPRLEQRLLVTCETLVPEIWDIPTVTESIDVSWKQGSSEPVNLRFPVLHLEEVNNQSLSLGGRRYTENDFKFEFEVMAGPEHSLFAPVTQTAVSTSTTNMDLQTKVISDGSDGGRTVVDLVLDSIDQTRTVTRRYSVFLNGGLGKVDRCFYPDIPGEYSIMARVEDLASCRSREAFVRVSARCNRAPEVVVLKGRNRIFVDADGPVTELNVEPGYVYDADDDMHVLEYMWIPGVPAWTKDLQLDKPVPPTIGELRNWQATVDLDRGLSSRDAMSDDFSLTPDTRRLSRKLADFQYITPAEPELPDGSGSISETGELISSRGIPVRLYGMRSPRVRLQVEGLLTPTSMYLVTTDRCNVVVTPFVVGVQASVETTAILQPQLPMLFGSENQLGGGGGLLPPSTGPILQPPTTKNPGLVPGLPAQNTPLTPSDPAQTPPQTLPQNPTDPAQTLPQDPTDPAQTLPQDPTDPGQNPFPRRLEMRSAAWRVPEVVSHESGVLIRQQVHAHELQRMTRGRRLDGSGSSSATLPVIYMTYVHTAAAPLTEVKIPLTLNTADPSDPIAPVNTTAVQQVVESVKVAGWQMTGYDALDEETSYAADENMSTLPDDVAAFLPISPPAKRDTANITVSFAAAVSTPTPSATPTPLAAPMVQEQSSSSLSDTAIVSIVIGCLAIVMVVGVVVVLAKKRPALPKCRMCTTRGRSISSLSASPKMIRSASNVGTYEFPAVPKRTTDNPLHRSNAASTLTQMGPKPSRNTADDEGSVEEDSREQ